MGEPRSRFTAQFERLAIDVLLETDVAGAAKILGLSWDEAQHVKERAVARGLARRPHQVPRVMGIDEKSLAKGHRYATIACDLDAGHVIGIAEGRSGASLLAALGRFPIDDCCTSRCSSRLSSYSSALNGLSKSGWWTATSA